MQDITDLAFWRVLCRRGCPDILFTEYFRVHPDSRPEKWIVRDLEDNDTGIPVVAQMVGEDIPSLVRTARFLEALPVIGVDLNLGCPAPVVCRKNAGGGLLKDPSKITDILTALRLSIAGNFTVKTRLGYSSAEEFDRLLEIYATSGCDMLTVHGRTVRQMYGGMVYDECLRHAAQRMPCPVLANGNAESADIALERGQSMGVAGWMIGRWAVRNPWIFSQLRAVQRAEPPFVPTLDDVRLYVEDLYRAIANARAPESSRVGRIKKFMNFILPGLTPEDTMLHAMRRAETEVEFFGLCDRWLRGTTPAFLPPSR
jgi:tRNA-dihydrouridine synthase